MALSADRNTQRRDGVEFSYPMAAAAHIFAGAFVELDAAGNAQPGSGTATKMAVGCAQEEINNTGGAAAKSIKVMSGCFKWANSAVGVLTKANIGQMVYIEDDLTVTSVSLAHSPAGIMVDIDTDGGIWVETRVPTSMLTGLLAANNLADVADAPTSRTSLGVGTGNSPTFVGLTLTGAETVALTLAVAGVTTYRKFLQVKAGAYTVQTPAIDGGTIIQDLTDNAVITLPNIAAANKGMVVTVQNVAADAAAKISIDPDASDKIAGTVAAVSSGAVANKDWINTKGTSKSGDYTTLVSDGTDTWWIIGGVGVWASE